MPDGRRVRAGLAVAWGVLLAASWAVRLARGDAEPDLPPGVHAVRVPVPGAEGRTVRLAWREEPGPDGEAPVFVLLHGSPGSRRDFDGVVPSLARHGRVLVPDLPGFGDSGRDLPDYSFRTHARFVAAWLDSLGVRGAHVTGFSMGGGAALHLADDRPDLVASLTLLSSIGVQELELLGHHGLNRALHGAQLLALRAARDLVPHFGALDRAAFGVEYARSFFDSDQRPLRDILGRLDPPVRILHGTEDFLVPIAAAREHARLVPQAELVTFAGANHFLPWSDGVAVAARIAELAGACAAGEAPTRARAAPERVSAAAVPWERIPHEPARGQPLVLLVLLLVAGTFVSEDLACVVAGILAAEGRLTPAVAVGACFAGIWAGDLALFAVGRRARGLLRRAPLRWIVDPAALDRARGWFRRRGLAAIFLSRFVPGMRLPVYVAAGATGAGFARFALVLLVAAGIWTPILVGAMAVAGRGALDAMDAGGRAPLAVAAGVAIALWAAVEVVLPCLTWTGRRVWRGRLCRWTRWEFWPPWLFYPPVAAYVLRLALRSRSLALPTAVNPAIPEGGLVGESKYDILRGLAGTPDRVARTALLRVSDDPEARVRQALAFVAEPGGGFPVVAKPDVGQRGAGVALARDPDELAGLARAARADLLLQEFVEGPEYGVFWVRHPGDPHGRIFSVTEKVLPEVTGDGRSTLERLILADDRAVCAHASYFRMLGDRLRTVPAAGERVPLTWLGTHCRGAIFRDGMRLVTPELERAVDEMSLRFEGFHFGRYDVRARDETAFRAGEFRVLELNGLTSEATAIYDAANSLRDAYRVLFAQWRLAFGIAAANVERGARPAPLRRIAVRVLAAARGSRA